MQSMCTGLKLVGRHDVRHGFCHLLDHMQYQQGDKRHLHADALELKFAGLISSCNQICAPRITITVSKPCLWTTCLKTAEAPGC